MSVPAIVSVVNGSGIAGVVVTITGSGFTAPDATDVTFGGASAAFTIIDGTTIDATVPAGSGIVDVFVTNPDGTSPLSPGSHFSYEVTPPPPLTEDCLSLTAGSFIADGVSMDADGISYTVQAIDGWFDSPPVRVGTLEAQPRGETIAAVHELGRAIDLQIVAHVLGGLPLGNVLCFTAMESIKTAFRVVFVPVVLDVVDPSGQERQGLVRRNGPIKQQILGDGVAVRFSIPLLGEDPRLVTV